MVVSNLKEPSSANKNGSNQIKEWLWVLRKEVLELCVVWMQGSFREWTISLWAAQEWKWGKSNVPHSTTPDGGWRNGQEVETAARLTFTKERQHQTMPKLPHHQPNQSSWQDGALSYLQLTQDKGLGTASGRTDRTNWVTTGPEHSRTDHHSHHGETSLILLSFIP